MTPQCWMMSGNKVLPAVHKKAIAVGIIDILTEFSIHLQMYQSLTPKSKVSLIWSLAVKQKFKFSAS
jgi:hypothetical protein